MSNSNIKLADIENKIQEIERMIPLEVRVVFATKRMRSAIGGMRCLIFALFFVALLIDVLWIPFPAWIIYFFATLPVVFLPASTLVKVPFGNRFIFRNERSFAVSERARQVFSDLHMGSTLAGNALLVFFCLGDRKFHILPDPRMEAALAEDVWQGYSSLVAEKLKSRSREADHGVSEAVLELLEQVKQKSLTVLGQRNDSAHEGELENKVLEIDI